MADPKNLESDPQWQEVKKVIRSVLLTNVKNGLTMNVMKQRYKELWQAPLDFKTVWFQRCTGNGESNARRSKVRYLKL